jgi:hypothetical protein
VKVKKNRLIQIIKEEIDDHTKELYGRDLETAADIGAAEEEIKNLKISLLKLRTMLTAEERVLGFKGYSASNEPDMSGIISTIDSIERQIEELELNIQIDMDDLDQRRQ